MLNYKKEEIKEYITEISEVIENIDFYINSFSEDGIVILKNIFCSELEQRRIQAEFGDKLGFYPDKSEMFSQYFLNCDDNGYQYTEDHKRAIEEHSSYPNVSINDIIVDPHLECTHYKFPQTAAFWYMHTFSCKPESGKTFFYDSRNMINALDQEYLSFLRKSKVLTNPSGDTHNNARCGIHDAIALHSNGNDEICRVDYKYPDHIFLYEYDNRIPEQEEVDFFYNEILSSIRLEIESAMKDPNFWYEWSEGDLVIPDLSVMYHAVNGGFSVGERGFLGFWSFPSDKKAISQFSDNPVENYVQKI